MQLITVKLLARVVALTVFIPAAVCAQGTPPITLEQHLREKFKPCPRNEEGKLLVEQGSALIIQKDGIVGVPMGPQAILSTSYKDGRLHPPGVVAKALVGGQQVFTPVLAGERVHLVNLEFNPKGDNFSFIVFSSTTRAGVTFQFPKGTLKTTDLARVDEVIGQVFSLNTGGNKITPLSQPQDIQTIAGEYVTANDPASQLHLAADGSFWVAQKGQRFDGSFTVRDNNLLLKIGQQVATGTIEGERILDNQGQTWVRRATETPMAEPPPPPPPPSDGPAPKTIEQGQTAQQVIAVMGQPMRIVKLGVKEIYFYKDLKITLTDGKVTDVE